MTSPTAMPLPPRRTARRPFITAFLEQVLPFADAASLLACSAVSRAWHVEAESPALWRRLCECAAQGHTGGGSMPLSVPEMKRVALPQSKLASECAGEAPVQGYTGDNAAQASPVTEQASPSDTPHDGTNASLPFVLVKQGEDDTMATNSSLFSAGLQYRIQRNAGQGAAQCGNGEGAPIGYACASPTAVLEQRIAALKRAVQALLQNAVAGQTSEVHALEAAVADARRRCPSDAALQLRRHCRRLLADMCAFETMATQAVLHGPSPTSRNNTPGEAATIPTHIDDDRKDEVEVEEEGALLRHARAIRSFVQLELLLARHGHTLSATRRRWRRLQACVPIDDSYYDLRDALQANETRQSKRRGAPHVTSQWLEQAPYAKLQAKLKAVLARQATVGRHLTYDELMHCIM